VERCFGGDTKIAQETRLPQGAADIRHSVKLQMDLGGALTRRRPGENEIREL
jgi:hypothetical protein